MTQSSNAPQFQVAMYSLVPFGGLAKKTIGKRESNYESARALRDAFVSDYPLIETRTSNIYRDQDGRDY